MPTWNPDSGDPLSNAAINALSVEETSMRLWHEFLTGWFDGNPHILRGTETSTMPLAAISVQDMDLPHGNAPKKNMEGLYIHVTADMGDIKKRLHPNGQWMCYQDAEIDFYVMAQVKEANARGQNSRSLCRQAADRLHSILQSHLLVTELSRKGMSVFRPKPHYLASSGGFYARHLPLSLKYVYPLIEQTVSLTVTLELTVDSTLVTADSTVITADRTLAQ